LQIVQEKNERAAGLREHAQELAHRLEKPLFGLRSRNVWYGSLVADNLRELGHQIYDDLAVRGERSCQIGRPLAQFRFIGADKAPYQTGKCLRQRGKWDIAAVLVELACREQTATRCRILTQPLHEGGFSDTRGAADENYL
jgi:hypothetical protein